MYVGRIVAVGQTKSGRNTGMYRISSRSFPNRSTRLSANIISVVPKSGFEADLTKNPYISYNCIKIAKNFTVISNGSHTDPIAEKIEMGYPVRDALSLALLAMDYEKDSYSTPRIAGVISFDSNIAYLASVAQKDLVVRAFNLERGFCFYVATYEHSTPCSHYKDSAFDCSTASEARDYIFNKGIFANMELPVTSAAAMSSENGFELSAELNA
ncbi:MAG TPA: IMP cyclohydrolase [Lentisphaeria bacterium]|nr:MAG: IMP cyclohydrolase [Lentisphaerae bacterium GWF2_38_69]HBM16722.1 IMP cyclohydrolase [Lentisphaeria bacterium]